MGQAISSNILWVPWHYAPDIVVGDYGGRVLLRQDFRLRRAYGGQDG